MDVLARSWVGDGKDVVVMALMPSQAFEGQAWQQGWPGAALTASGSARSQCPPSKRAWQRQSTGCRHTATVPDGYGADCHERRGVLLRLRDLHGVIVEQHGAILHELGAEGRCDHRRVAADIITEVDAMMQGNQYL